MIESKLIRLYSILHKNEKIWLKKWIISPIANNNKQIIQLFNVLETRNAITPSTVKKERIFKLIYPNNKYDDSKLRHLISDATKVLELFITYYVFKQDAFYQQTKIAGRLMNANLNDFSSNYLKEARRIIEDNKLRDGNYFHALSTVSFQQLQNSAHQIQQEVKHLQAYQQETEYYFMLECLKTTCFSHAQNQVLNIEYTNYFLTTVLEFINKNKLKINASITIYYLLYQLTVLEQENVLKELMQLISKERTIFSIEEFRDIYLLIINFCIKKLNTTNNTSYALYAFNLYIDGIKNDILLIDQKIDKLMYRNCIAMGIKANQLEATNQFILDYEHLLMNADTDFINYCKAYLLVAQKKYNIAAKLLISINLKDALLNLNAKFLLVKIYLETFEIDVLKSYLKSFKQFLQRNVKIAYHKQIYNLMLKYVIKIIKLQGASKKQKQILANEINAISIPDKDWFLKMITEIK